jgi:hypothetical protein
LLTSNTAIGNLGAPALGDGFKFLSAGFNLKSNTGGGSERHAEHRVPVQLQREHGDQRGIEQVQGTHPRRRPARLQVKTSS